MHVLTFHHDLFIDRIHKIRRSVEDLLHRNQHAVVAIKGPHTFRDSPAGGVRINDYFGLLHIDIMRQEFFHLQDRVVLLHHRDMTIAKEVKWNHPPPEVDRAMIKQLFSLVCSGT
jgi:hypothetical protein